MESIIKSKYREVTDKRHTEQLKKIDIYTDTILIGDSFFERLEWFSKINFNKNIKILAKGGDTIEHLLWRIENTPKNNNIKNVILNIGTNNLTNKFNDTQINDFINKIYYIIEEIKNIFPNSKIYYLPICFRKDIDKILIDKINIKINSNNNFVFLRNFWSDIIISNGYDVKYFCDNVHLNLNTNMLFYNKILNII